MDDIDYTARLESVIESDKKINNINESMKDIDIKLLVNLQEYNKFNKIFIRENNKWETYIKLDIAFIISNIITFFNLIPLNYIGDLLLLIGTTISIVATIINKAKIDESFNNKIKCEEENFILNQEKEELIIKKSVENHKNKNFQDLLKDYCLLKQVEYREKKSETKEISNNKEYIRERKKSKIL